MIHSKCMSTVTLGTMIAALAIVGTAKADGVEIPKSTTAPPTGPGAEAPPSARAQGVRAIEGYQGSLQIGSGFIDTYGLGLGARVGYTFPQGIYVGGAVTHYFGNSVTTASGELSAHATFVGAEGGYELFPTPRWEIRPYVFVGPAFIREVNEVPFTSESKTRFAIQPGLLTAYHFGDAFVSAEAKAHVTPDPTALTVLGGAGMGF